MQAIHGVGPVLAAVFVAEIGDVGRFPSPDYLCSWAGLTPRHRESDTRVRRGSITKQESKQVRWAAVEAISRNHGGDKIRPTTAASPSGVVATSAARPRPEECSASSATPA